MEKESMQKIVGDLLKSGKYVLVRDGWEQLKPEFFIEQGFPKELIYPIVKTYKSDGTYKGSLWKDTTKGAVVHGDMTREVDKLSDEQRKDPEWLQLIDQKVLKRFLEVYIHEAKGVYYLDFLYALCKLFGVEPKSALGRGSQAGKCINAIHKHLDINLDEFGNPFIKETA
jgi:hypothetical protein